MSNISNNLHFWYYLLLNFYPNKNNCQCDFEATGPVSLHLAASKSCSVLPVDYQDRMHETNV